jgi:CheY-like chemotaxis protein
MEIDKTVLLVDDDEDDLDMLQLAFKSVNFDHAIVEARDGEAAFDRLKKMKDAGGLPCLIVMDINMPRMDGRMAFKKLQLDDAYSKIPIVIFSTSRSALDRLYFQKNNAAYFTKPVDFQEFIETALQMMAHCAHNEKSFER